jgi:hypothetical protein
VLETKCLHCAFFESLSIKPASLATLRLRFRIYAILNKPLHKAMTNEK